MFINNYQDQNNVKERKKPTKKVTKIKKEIDKDENKEKKVASYTRKFQCAECGKAFHSKDFLEDHKSIHTGIKKHPCPVCGVVFSFRHNQRKHVRKFHPNEKY